MTSRTIATSRTSGVALILASLVLTGCVHNSSNNPGSTAISVTSSATECTLSSASAPSGSVVFTVTNTSDKITEFYLLGEDGLSIAGEVENIGPGISRDLVMNAKPGKYFSICKPGMDGDGVGRAEFTVTDSGAHGATNSDFAGEIATANANYASYVKDQIEQLVVGTEAFAAKYTAGENDAARALYAATRVHWERVETVAESFGDLDPRMDLREADLTEGQAWTGWHAIEKDLWPANAEPEFTAYSATKRETLARQLVADTHTLNAKAQDLEFTLDQQTNGAIGLLDEVASGKVTGEEEFWSHTDLWDFQANIDGAAVLYAGVRGILEQKDATLAASLDREFASLQAELDKHRVGDGFALYTDLSTPDIRALSDRVNALAEPLSQLTAALVL